MTSLQINDSDIPRLDGKTAIVTGGSSGIGLATVRLLTSRGARTYALDLQAPVDGLPEGATFIKCDQTSWDELNAAFAEAGGADIAVANAGVSEAEDFSTDVWEDEPASEPEQTTALENGNKPKPAAVPRLREPNWGVVDVNLRGTVGFVKLASAWMRRRGDGSSGGGGIVVTSSATAYAPEQSLPVYAATKHGVVGFMRAARSTLLHNDGITINSVAPAATITALLPRNLAEPLMAAGLPVSSPEFVARAVVYSATAGQSRPVEPYGKDKDFEADSGKAATASGSASARSATRWNGRTILTLGDTYTELEGGLAETKPQWFGAENLRLTRMQQTATDFRQF